MQDVSKRNSGVQRHASKAKKKPLDVSQGLKRSHISLDIACDVKELTDLSASGPP